MRVLVVEDHHIPRVALHFFYRVGSRNEHPGNTGISHFLEHMMFNGAQKYGPGEFDRETEKCGGDNNAYTTPDLTVYTDWFPASEIERVMDLEADRMRNLRFDTQIVETERRVVEAERRSRSESDNLGYLYERLNAVAFVAHPYRWPVTGWESDTNSWTVSELQDYYRMGYAPNNCLLVIVGDVTVARALSLARTHLETIPPHSLPPSVETSEPKQDRARRVVVSRSAQLAAAMFAYHVPASKHADYAAIQMMGAILAEGRSSRLYKALVDHGQMATSVSWSQLFSLDPGELTFGVEARRGADLRKLEQVFLSELDRVAEGVTNEEMGRARTQLVTNLYRGLRTLAGKADTIGKYEIYFGSFRKLFNLPGELNRVTTADVRRVARAYLDSANRTAAILVPELPGGQGQEASE